MTALLQHKITWMNGLPGRRAGERFARQQPALEMPAPFAVIRPSLLGQTARQDRASIEIMLKYSQLRVFDAKLLRRPQLGAQTFHQLLRPAAFDARNIVLIFEQYTERVRHSCRI
jgi:hypothetical protein